MFWDAYRERRYLFPQFIIILPVLLQAHASPKHLFYEDPQIQLYGCGVDLLTAPWKLKGPEPPSSH